MDADYLRDAVGDSLSQALAATVLANPNDPVDYLARYLTKQLTIKQTTITKDAELIQLINEDAKFEQEQSAIHKSYSLQIKNDALQRQRNETELQQYLQSINNPVKLFDGFFKHMMPLIDTKSLSFYSFVIEGADAESQVLRFQSISQSPYAPPDVNRDLINCKLVRTEGKGIVFTLFDESDENEEPVEESNDESAAFVDRSLVVDARLPTIFLPNVRVGPKAGQVHFFRTPQSGSFLAVRFKWQSVISEASFDDALEKIHEREERKREEEEARVKAAEEAGEEEQPEPEEEEEEEIDEDDEDAVRLRDEKRAEREAKRAELAKIKAETPEEKEARLAHEAQLQREQEDRELLASITKQTINQAVCVDTLKSGARLPDQAVKFVHNQSRLLMESALRIDRNRFKPELAAYETFVEWQTARNKKNEEEKEASDEEAKEQRSKIKDELTAADQPSSVQDIELAYTISAFVAIASDEGLAKARACSILRGGAIEVYQAALLLAGYERDVVGDWEWRNEWTRVRNVLDQTFVDRIAAYKPRDDEDASKEKQAKQFISSVDVERITERNSVTLALYNWIKAVIDIRRRVRLERKKEKERLAREEAARLAAEEEERQKKQEEDEANAAAAAEANQENQDEEEAAED